MSDLFHPDIPTTFVRQVFDVMLAVPRHTYQVLTKRPSRAASFLKKNHSLLESGRLPAHIWLGTSIENQAVAHRERHLGLVPATVRFLSCEPLLGPVSLSLVDINWVIAGGESGPVHRKMDLEWARHLRDQCLAKGVSFFFKQVGGRTPKAHGRTLDGRTWDEFPPSSSPFELGAQA